MCTYNNRYEHVVKMKLSLRRVLLSFAYDGARWTLDETRQNDPRLFWDSCWQQPQACFRKGGSIPLMARAMQEFGQKAVLSFGTAEKTGDGGLVAEDVPIMQPAQVPFPTGSTSHATGAGAPAWYALDGKLAQPAWQSNVPTTAWFKWYRLFYL